MLYFLLIDRFSDGREAGYLDVERPTGGRQHGPAFRRTTPATRSGARTTRRGGGGGSEPGRRQPRRGPEQDRVPAQGRRQCAVDQPRPEAGGAARRRAEQLPRLRDAGLPEGRAGLRHERRISVRWSPPPTPRVFGSSWTSSSITPATSSATTWPIRRGIRRPATRRSARWTRGGTARRIRWPAGGRPTGASSRSRRRRRPPSGPTAPSSRPSCTIPRRFSRQGRIIDWDHSPEYLDGDFVGLKDIAHGSGPLDEYRPSPALHRADPGVLLVDRVRRHRRLPGRHRQAHGSRGHPVLHLGGPRVRAVHREGQVPAGRRDHRLPAGRHRNDAADRSGRRARAGRRPGATEPGSNRGGRSGRATSRCSATRN